MLIGFDLQDDPEVGKRLITVENIAYADDDGKTITVYFVGGKQAKFTKRDRASFIGWFNQMSAQNQGQRILRGVPMLRKPD